MEIVIGCQDRVQCKYNATVTSKWQFTAGEASWFATSQHTMSGIDNANVMAAGAERSGFNGHVAGRSTDQNASSN